MSRDRFDEGWRLPLYIIGGLFVAGAVVTAVIVGGVMAVEWAIGVVAGEEL